MKLLDTEGLRESDGHVSSLGSIDDVHLVQIIPELGVGDHSSVLFEIQVIHLRQDDTKWHQNEQTSPSQKALGYLETEIVVRLFQRCQNAAAKYLLQDGSSEC